MLALAKSRDSPAELSLAESLGAAASHRLGLTLFLAGAVCLLMANSASALPLSYLLQVRPVMICQESAGSVTCPTIEPGFLEQETDKIFAQAGIDVEFLDLLERRQAMPSVFDSIEDAAVFGSGDGIVEMIIVGAFGTELKFGEASQINNLIVIDDDVFTAPRRDTIAHELTHLLGELHATDPFNLMTGLGRLVPESLDQISLDGLSGRSRLTPTQIARMIESPHLQSVPEPTTGQLLLLSFLGLSCVGRRSRRC